MNQWENQEEGFAKLKMPSRKTILIMGMVLLFCLGAIGGYKLFQSEKIKAYKAGAEYAQTLISTNIANQLKETGELKIKVGEDKFLILVPK